jgi:hypothetical protein
MSSLFDAVAVVDNNTVTENGMPAYKSTLSKVLDLFTDGFSYRRNPKGVENVVREAALENKELALRCLFYLRDIHEGQGERAVFRHGMRTLLSMYPEFSRNLIYIPVGHCPDSGKPYGRWDDLVALLGVNKEVDSEIYSIIRAQLAIDTAMLEDGNITKISLLAKWLPSANTSSKRTRAIAKSLYQNLGLKDERSYRKILSALRAATNVVETKISKKEYTFDYSKLPSRAIHKYRKAFERNDNARFTAYHDTLHKVLVHSEKCVADVKINTAGLYPYDIVKPILRSANSYAYSIPTSTELLQLDNQWRSLRNYFEGTAGNHNWLAVVDTSGSMFDAWDKNQVASIEVAVSLGLYVAEHNNGLFKNQMITFSNRPSFITVDDKWPLIDKVKHIANADWQMNTDLEAVFNLVLEAAVSHKIPAEQMPEALVIISDMQFDQCTYNRDCLSMIRSKYEAAGYACPKLVFWNASARANCSKPITRDKTGTILVGGCKPGMFEQVLASKSPEDFMKDVLNAERYSVLS